MKGAAITPPPPGIPEGTGTRMQSKEGAVNRQRYEGCPDSGAGARERVAGRLSKQHTHKKSKQAAEGSRAGTQEDPPLLTAGIWLNQQQQGGGKKGAQGGAQVV